MIPNEKHYGFYLGVVIQNNDPEKRGRVKVWVPHINLAVYEGWNKEFSSGTDKAFIFPDKELNADLTAVMPYLKKALPWAESVMPVFGGGASARYNAVTGKAVVSDSNFWKNGNIPDGFRPAHMYTGDSQLVDAFSRTVPTFNQTANPNCNQYTPSDYSNLAKGEFSIPNVGAHVWVFFMGGDVGYPVIIGVSHGREDWQRIYTKNQVTGSPRVDVNLDYPESYENLDSGERGVLNEDTQTFRSKHVINTNKHTIELIDTDQSEVLKFTHYSGSFLEFNNNTTTRLATNNDQLLVIGDQFMTVRKSQNVYVAQTMDLIVEGDRLTKIGNFDIKKDSASKIMQLLSELHDYKLLFEVQRTDANGYNSKYQKRKGDYAKCPVCSGSGDKFGFPCVTCSGSGESPSTQWGDWKDDDIKWEFISVPTTSGNKTISILGSKVYNTHKKVSELEAIFGNGGDDIVTITSNKIITVGTVFNDLLSYRVDMKGKLRNEGTHVAPEGTYASMSEAPLIEYVDVDSPPGGDMHLTVGNSYKLNVGSNGVQVKTTGAMQLGGTLVDVNGESINIGSRLETTIDGGHRLEMRADVINLKPTHGKRNEVLVDGSLGVGGNTNMLGGLHVEGELTYLHQTAPLQMYLTEIGYGPLPHAHIFYAPPWTLLPTCEDVRTVASMNNYPVPSPNMKCYNIWIPN